MSSRRSSQYVRQTKQSRDIANNTQITAATHVQQLSDDENESAQDFGTSQSGPIELSQRTTQSTASIDQLALSPQLVAASQPKAYSYKRLQTKVVHTMTVNKRSNNNYEKQTNENEYNQLRRTATSSCPAPTRKTNQRAEQQSGIPATTMSAYSGNEIVARTTHNDVPETLFVQSSMSTEQSQNRRNSIEQSDTERPSKHVATQAISERRDSGNQLSARNHSLTRTIQTPRSATARKAYTTPKRQQRRVQSEESINNSSEDEPDYVKDAGKLDKYSTLQRAARVFLFLNNCPSNEDIADFIHSFYDKVDEDGNRIPCQDTGEEWIQAFNYIRNSRSSWKNRLLHSLEDHYRKALEMTPEIADYGDNELRQFWINHYSLEAFLNNWKYLEGYVDPAQSKPLAQYVMKSQYVQLMTATRRVHEADYDANSKKTIQTFYDQLCTTEEYAGLVIGEFYMLSGAHRNQKAKNKGRDLTIRDENYRSIGIPPPAASPNELIKWPTVIDPNVRQRGHDQRHISKRYDNTVTRTVQLPSIASARTYSSANLDSFSAIESLLARYPE